MNTSAVEPQTDHAPKKAERLYHLDWLRVILILGVFLYHAVSPFREGYDWHITNLERSVTVTSILVFVWPWALLLFFLVAGAASMFALRRRSNRQYIGELMSSPIQRKNPVRVLRPSHSTSPSSTVTKYLHWRRLKQGRKVSRNWRNALERHIMGLGMAHLRDNGLFAHPIIYGMSRAR